MEKRVRPLDAAMDLIASLGYEGAKGSAATMRLACMHSCEEAWYWEDVERIIDSFIRDRDNLRNLGATWI